MLTMLWSLHIVMILLGLGGPLDVVVVVGAAEVNDSHGLSEAFLQAIGTVSLDQLVKESPQSGLNQSCFNSAGRYSTLRTCLRSQCISGDDVAKLYGVTSDEQLETRNLSQISAGLLYVLTQKASCSSEVFEYHEPPTTASVWGYGFLFVTLINVCSMFGACVLPCVHSKVYKVLLLFMVALAVGTLVGSGLLVLIPEALELTTSEQHKNFLWKMTTVMGGIYLFFLVERIMRMINNWRENTRDKKERDQKATEGTYTSFFQRQAPDPHLHPHPQSVASPSSSNGAFSNSAFVGGDGAGQHERGDCSHTQPPSANLVAFDECAANNNGSDLQQNGNGNSNSNITTSSSPGGDSEEKGGGKRVKIAPVAYMVIFGDALHNMIDGLSIGAAFTESTLLGISLSVAVMCEELPHELGDFAILLNSGMSMRKALLYNFLSSLSCYVGLVLGIQLGENTSANTWIFAIAGGMFLYISLADMLPEMNSAAESPDGKELGEVKTFLIQNLGLLTGFGIILVLVAFGEYINFE